MIIRFVDTNIFIRYLTQDDPDKAQACYELFLRAEQNEVALTTSESVVAELVYVLSSKRLYALPREEIRALLYPLLSIRGLKLARRETYLRALDIYAAYPVDFEDALAVAQMEQQGLTEIYSYDHDFDRLPDIQRLEP